jgi:putative copper resistance protein D
MRGKEWLVCMIGVVVFSLPPLLFAQHHDAPHASPHQHGTTAYQWEGSPEGKAYSEFNHHLAGAFVLLIGLSELPIALAVTTLAWTRFLLPVAMLGAGGYLIVWSDHDAWPIGSQGFVQTFFSGDVETVQHKLYAVFLLCVGTLEMLRRAGRIEQAVWRMPLPVFAILGGIVLFLHSHGLHPAAQKIALHHGVMGVMAIVAGSCKLAAWPSQSSPQAPAWAGGAWFRWELAWATLIVLIGVQLLVYAE